MLDTSALLALLDRDDPDHSVCAAALRSERPPYLVPAGILSEVGYLTERKVGAAVLTGFLEDLASGAFTLDCGEQDFTRIIELIRGYR